MAKVLPPQKWKHLVKERRDLKRRLLILKSKGKVMSEIQQERIAEVS